jgi:hypothetical protein
MKRKQILINIESYETLVAQNLEQIAEMKRHMKELEKMNDVFVKKMIKLTKEYKRAE